MKKIVRLTETDLTRIINRIILEMDDPSRKLTSKDWEKIWFKLRRLSPSFQYPDFQNYFFTFGGLDFHYKDKDGSLELHPMFRDPYNWRDNYEDGAEVLEKYADKIEKLIDESGLDIKFEMGPRFDMRIYKP